MPHEPGHTERRAERRSRTDEAGSFRRDVGWHAMSLIVLAVAGTAVNVIIGRTWGAAVFGVFSQVLSIYYVIVQLAVGGFPLAALHDVGRSADDPVEAGRRAAAAVLPTMGLAAAVCLALWAAHGAIGSAFDSRAVGIGVAWTLPGLWFFAINKTLQGAINGLRMMRLYAAVNAARYVMVLAGVAAFAVFDVDGVALPVTISAGEILLTPVLLVALLRATRVPAGAPGRLSGLRRIMPAQAWFASRGFPAGLLHDLNPKVDVIMLGLFAGDRAVGIYAFAAMIAEGAYQVIWVLQANLAPRFSRFDAATRRRRLARAIRRNALVVPPAFAAATLVGWWLYPGVARLITDNVAFAAGGPYFVVLMLGLTVASVWYPFAVALNQWGYPGRFVGWLAAQFVVNVALNLLLIPRIGPLGAAIASASAFVGASLLLHAMLFRVAR